MTARYAYTPYVWPMIAAVVAAAILAAYVWRRSSAAPARPLAFMALLGIPWALGAALEVAAVDAGTKVFWFKYHVFWELPAATAALWFAFEYADLGRWLTPRGLRVLALPPLIVGVLLLGDARYHWMWNAIWVAHGQVRADPTTLNVLVHGYGLVISVATALVFLWLFLTSPLHRPAAALCLVAQVVARGAHALDRTHLPAAMEANPLATMDLPVLLFPIVAGIYVLALFRFRLFDVLPVAHGSIIDQMREGMLVLNAEEEILDLNPAAERLLGISASKVRGRRVKEVFPDYPALTLAARGRHPGESEIRFGPPGAQRHYALHYSPLANRRTGGVGSLVLVQDVSRERDAQAKVLDQQKSLAVLSERARVARELHDSLGQVLGYVKMQAQAAREMLLHGRVQEVDQLMGRMAQAAQDAHSEVRDYILDSRPDIFADANLIDTLRRYVRRYSAVYDIDATLEVEPGLDGESFDPAAAWQLLRIVQEALTNVRKHAGTLDVRVRLLKTADCCAEAVIEDHGIGFDPGIADDGQRFGLRFMRERAAQIGASLRIESTPGHGTRVIATVPLRQESHANLAG